MVRRVKRWGGVGRQNYGERECVRACMRGGDQEREIEREREREPGTYVVKIVCTGMYYFFLFVRMDCFTISKDGELAKQPLSDLMA